MSADNWDVCPFCVRRRALGVANREAEVDAAYGKVPIEQFEAMRAELAEFRAREPERTLREDYETGLLDSSSGVGNFYVRYKARCSTCNWSHQFKHDEIVPVADPKEPDV